MTFGTAARRPLLLRVVRPSARNQQEDTAPARKAEPVVGLPRPRRALLTPKPAPLDRESTSRPGRPDIERPDHETPERCPAGSADSLEPDSTLSNHFAIVH
jgi:hypothetical protein